MTWLIVVKLIIPPHQAFVLLSCGNDLVAKFLRVDADATSKRHLEPRGCHGGAAHH